MEKTHGVDAVSFVVKIIFLVAILSGLDRAQTASIAGPRENSADADEIRTAITEIERAFVARDLESFGRSFLEGYVGIREKPVYNALDQLTAMMRWDTAAVKAGKTLSFETLAYESDPALINIFGDAALVSSLKKHLWRYKDDRCLSQYQATELWVRSDGRWKLAVGHMTTIPCDPMPWQPPHPALADVRARTKPQKFLSPTVETELRQLVSKLTTAGLLSDTSLDAFTPEYFSTDLNGQVSPDRSQLLSALQLPTNRLNQRYRDDEVFLNFGSAAMYLFRVRSLAKSGETKPDPPIVFSVFFVKPNGNWKIAASQASTFTD